jgi:hypothetical protein
VQFVARVDEPLESAELVLGRGEEGRRGALKIEVDAAGAPRKVLGEFEVTEDVGEYRLILRAVNGLENRDPIRFTVRGQVDRSPEITVHDPIGTEDISKYCVRPMDLVVNDDFGVKEIGLEYKVSGQKEIDWTYRAFTPEDNQGVEYGETRIHTLFLPGLDVEELGVQPGDFVHVRYRATDYKDIGQRNVTVTKEYRFEVIPLVELQARLERDIEKIKNELERTHTGQERLYDQVGRYLGTRGLADKDRLTALEAGEVRESALEQNGITNRIERAGRDIVRVHRRGVYNKIFEEDAAKELVNAAQELEALLKFGERAGPSPLAAAHLQEASKVRVAAARRDGLREAQNMQSIVMVGIKEAIRYLKRWSTYQEVIRLTRRAYEAQKKVNEGIKKNPK